MEEEPHLQHHPADTLTVSVSPGLCQTKCVSEVSGSQPAVRRGVDTFLLLLRLVLTLQQEGWQQDTARTHHEDRDTRTGGLQDTGHRTQDTQAPACQPPGVTR